MEKQCSNCGGVKDIDEFYKNRNTSDGRQSWCIECHRLKGKQPRNEHQKMCDREAIRKWRQTPKGKRSKLRRTLKSTFGITIEDYERMLWEQRGVCAICGRPETRKLRGKVKRLSVDHDHLTKKVRGLLCGSCNIMIGHARENMDILNNGARYLSKHRNYIRKET